MTKQLRTSSETIDELGQLIGQPLVVKLCEALGGAKIYIPRQIGPSHPIAVAIGVKAAAIVADHYYGTQIDLPKAHARRARMIELA
ncbi:MAG: hypothetical protein FJ335_11635, partial [Sphingomonadales bacterium]|nr:hypothetical protein [Sphingomonadales bacterium]